MITAQDAVDHLYRIAVTENKATSTARLDTLAEFCVQELTRRGLRGAEQEASIPGAGRRKMGRRLAVRRQVSAGLVSQASIEESRRNCPKPNR